MDIPARPTTYRGIPMRSRLEARFAARLDQIGVRMGERFHWEYEPRAFANERGQYLPDFVIYDGPLPSCYIEVKPTLEKATRALERMQIIWDSEPTAVLWVDVMGAGMFTAYPGEPWRWTPF